MRPTATINMRSGAKIVMELYPEIAPNTVNAFVHCVRKGIYNKQPIRRIVPGFVIQPSYNDFEHNKDAAFEIEGEFAMNGFTNNLSFEPYVVGMGTEGGMSASGSCFFITVGEAKRLDGKFPGFGRVISGFEELERLCQVELKEVPNDEGVTIKEPVSEEVMEEVTLEENGYLFGSVVRIDG